MRFFITLNILIVVLIVLRKLMKGKVSCKVQYAAWIILPIFMLVGSFISIPVVIEKQQDVAEYKNTATVYESSSSGFSTDSSYTVASEYSYAGTVKNNYAFSSAKKESTPGTITIDYKTVAVVAWISIATIIGAVILINNISFSRMARKTRKWFSKSQYGNLKVYKLKGLDSPFLLWNSIYIPEDLGPDSEHYAMSLYHEYCHYKLGDCFWNVIRNLFVIVLWFDPLVWIAYFLIQHDNELAVDEMVIKWNGEDNRVKYGEMLLSYVSNISGLNRFSSVATSMSGKSKNFMKERILNIAKKSGATKYAAVIVSTVLITASVCLLIKPHIVYKEAAKADTEAKVSSFETEKESTTEETIPSVLVEENDTAPTSASESAEKNNAVYVSYPEPKTGIVYETRNIFGAEEFKIPDEIKQQEKNILVNCSIINITRDYVYVGIDGTDYEKKENICRICRYESIDGKQGDLIDSVDIDNKTAVIINVYEADGKTYAILICSHEIYTGYVFDIYELDFEKGTASPYRTVNLEGIPDGISYMDAAYYDGTIYVSGSIYENGKYQGAFFEITEDGYTRVEWDKKTEAKYSKLLDPVYKL
ncbi:MAG: M56 family metallopeptidase [Clostridiales bacterium]|nr:M56 family metallopeptidase [Clostridiales bacterium]